SAEPPGLADVGPDDRGQVDAGPASAAGRGSGVAARRRRGAVAADPARGAATTGRSAGDARPAGVPARAAVVGDEPDPAVPVARICGLPAAAVRALSRRRRCAAGTRATADRLERPERGQPAVRAGAGCGALSATRAPGADGDRDRDARGDGDGGLVADLAARPAGTGRTRRPGTTTAADEDDVDRRDAGGRGVRAGR